MVAYILRRAVLMAVSVFIVVSVVFFLVHLVPGGPAEAALGIRASTQAIADLEKVWGLDRPLGEQYISYLSDLLHGNLGYSYFSRKSVTELFARTFPYTFALTFASVFVGILTGLPLGIVAALRRNSFWDNLSRFVALLGMSLPSFYLGTLCLYLFALVLGIFPAMGAGKAGNLGSQLHALVLPALAGGLYMSAYVARTIRSSMLSILSTDYIRTARSKGLREYCVIVKHALRNSLIPLVTLLGIYAGILFASSVLLEIVFTRPGVGRLLVGAIKQRDYIVLQSLMVVYALYVMVINLLTDLSYGFLDPRIHYN